MALQSAAANQAEAREHLLDRVRDRVGEKPLAAKAIGSRSRQKRARAFVDKKRHTEFNYRLVKRVVIGIIDIASFDRIGPDKNPFKAKLGDSAFGFIDGQF